jgi:hypothetical protein
MVTLFRHVRGFEFDPTTQMPEISSRGGVTFLFNIDQDNDELHYAFAICDKYDNFSRELGRHWATKRFASGDVRVISYDKTLPLVENVLLDLTARKAVDKSNQIDTLSNSEHTLLKTLKKLVFDRKYVERVYNWYK